MDKVDYNGQLLLPIRDSRRDTSLSNRSWLLLLSSFIWRKWPQTTEARNQNWRPILDCNPEWKLESTLESQMLIEVSTPGETSLSRYNSDWAFQLAPKHVSLNPSSSTCICRYIYFKSVYIYIYTAHIYIYIYISIHMFVCVCCIVYIQQSQLGF